MKPRRRHGGLLSGMVKYPQGRHRKPASIGRRIATWTAAGLFVLVVGGFVVALFWSLFHPDAGQPGTVEVPVLQIVENPPGYPPEAGVVANAYVPIRGKRVAVPLTAETRAGVEIGTVLRVEHTWRPKYQRVTVERWTALPGAVKPPDGPPPAP